jgi:hypothetical protein
MNLGDLPAILMVFGLFWLIARSFKKEKPDGK